MKRGHPHGPHLVRGKAYLVLLLGLVIMLMLVIIVGISIGAVLVSWPDVWRIIGSHIFGSASANNGVADSIVWDFRTPRVLIAVIVGAGLAVAGATLQAVVRNPLADPYLLGVSSGASLAAVAAITLGSSAVAGLSVSAAAFVGAMGALLLVLLLGQRGGQLAPTRVILAGVAVSYLLASATSYLQLRAHPDELAGVLFWLLGSLSGASWDQLGLPALCVCVCMMWLMAHRRDLNSVLLGDESAASLGINLRFFRLHMLMTAALLTGAVIAVAGGVGFIGLMIPHIARLLVGPDHALMLPVSAILGGLCLAMVDIISRTIESPMELPLGIFTAILGAPFLLWLLRHHQPGQVA